MKQAITLFLAMFLSCIPTFGQGSGTSQTITFSSGGSVELAESLGGTIVISGLDYDCVEFTRYTGWDVGFVGDSSCHHLWVYALEADVNPSRGYTTLQYCQCGCTTTTNEARLCEKCYRGEVRARFNGWDLVVKEESTYSKLLKKQPKN